MKRQGDYWDKAGNIQMDSIASEAIRENKSYALVK
jgi:hypothetical protein